MKPFILEQWHAWEGVRGAIMLSDEYSKTLRSFATVDNAVNWLFINQYKHVARALNAHAKGQ